MNKIEIVAGVGIITVLIAALRHFTPDFFNILIAAVILFGFPLLVIIIFLVGIYMIFEGFSVKP